MVAVHLLISTTPLLQKIAYVYALEMISLYFHLSERSLKLQMSLPPLSFHSLSRSADIWISEMPAALLSIRATNLTKQGSRSMSPFVTCHWGTS